MSRSSPEGSRSKTHQTGKKGKENKPKGSLYRLRKKAEDIAKATPGGAATIVDLKAHIYAQPTYSLFDKNKEDQPNGKDAPGITENVDIQRYSRNGR